MIWSSTKKVGIASARSKSGNVYVVARYFPTGNFIGEFPYWKYTWTKFLGIFQFGLDEIYLVELKGLSLSSLHSKKDFFILFHPSVNPFKLYLKTIGSPPPVNLT